MDLTLRGVTAIRFISTRPPGRANHTAPRRGRTKDQLGGLLFPLAERGPYQFENRVWRESATIDGHRFGTTAVCISHDYSHFVRVIVTGDQVHGAIGTKCTNGSQLDGCIFFAKVLCYGKAAEKTTSKARGPETAIHA